MMKKKFDYYIMNPPLGRLGWKIANEERNTIG